LENCLEKDYEYENAIVFFSYHAHTYHNVTQHQESMTNQDVSLSSHVSVTEDANG